MTPDEILAKVREARTICDAATAGPWGVDGLGDVYAITGDEVACGHKCGTNVLESVDRTDWNPDDSEFAAKARAGWPDALDLVETLIEADDIRQGALDAATAELARHRTPDLPPDPPPGKMRVTASVPVIYDVSPWQIAAYLRANGWEQSGHRWQKGHDVVRTHCIDDLELVETYLIPNIAEAESRPSGAVLRDIAAMEEA